VYLFALLFFLHRLLPLSSTSGRIRAAVRQLSPTPRSVAAGSWENGVQRGLKVEQGSPGQIKGNKQPRQAGRSSYKRLRSDGLRPFKPRVRKRERRGPGGPATIEINAAALFLSSLHAITQLLGSTDSWAGTERSWPDLRYNDAAVVPARERSTVSYTPSHPGLDAGRAPPC